MAGGDTACYAGVTQDQAVGITTSTLLGSLVRRYRREAELTQEALAERAGLSVRVIRRIENGSQHRPRQDTVQLLLEALAVPVDDQAAFWAAASQFRTAPSAPAEPHAAPARSPAQLLTVLIADMRGYTAYTVEHGDEAGAELAAQFGAITRAVAEQHGGELLELRGDEAVCLLASARQALRAALALQEEYLHPVADGGLPLGVGIGLDAGEIVPVQGGYRGRALNLAARLCSQAAAGEVLTSESVLHLAGAIEQIAAVERGSVTMKGVPEPVRVIQVTQEAEHLSDPEGVTVRAAAPVGQQRLPIGGFAGSLPVGTIVGREAELAHMLRAVHSVTQGDGRLVLLAGEPGVGKTRLLQEVTVAVRERGFLVAAGRCYEPEQTVPYYPFLDAMAALWEVAPVDLRAETAKRWRHLGALLPEALPMPSAPAAPGQDDQQRIFRAATGFLQKLTESVPIALLLDDLHWADGSSLTLLRHLASHTRTSRLLLLGSYRDVEVGRQHPLEGTLLDLRRDGLADTVPVRRLSPEGTAALVAVTLDGDAVPSALAERLHARTEGNPFFVTQVLSVLPRGTLGSPQTGGWDAATIEGIEVPESIRAVVGRRLSRLTPETQAILHEAGVLGQRFWFDDLHQMAARSEEEIEAALTEACEQRLLAVTGKDEYGFDHVLTQQVLYAELPARRKRRLHLAAGAMLERLPDVQRHTRVAELAWHFLHGDDAERALPHAEQAGDQAVAVFAYPEAERHYRTAIELAQGMQDDSREANQLWKLGNVLQAMGRYDEALQAFEQLADAYQETGDLEAEASIVARIGTVHTDRGTAQEGLARLQPVLARMEGLAPSRGLAALSIPLVWLYEQLGRSRDSLSAAQRAVELARTLQDRGMLAQAQMLLGNALSVVSVEAMRQTLEAAIPLAEAEDDLDTVFWALHALVQTHLDAGEPEAGRVCAARALEIGERVNDPQLLGAAEVDLGLSYLELGDWERARAHGTRAAEILRTLDSTFQLGWPELFLAQLCLGEGRWDQASAYLDELMATEDIGHASTLWEAKRLRAELDLMTGRPEAALAHLQPLLDSAAFEEAKWTYHLSTAAEAYLSMGKPDLARTNLRKGLAMARELQIRRTMVWMLRVEGMVLSHDGRRVEAEAAFTEATSLARRSSNPYEEARTLYQWGLAFSRCREDVEARERLERALLIFQRLDAVPFARRTNEALAVIDSRSRRDHDRRQRY
jgi:class 3 adenylate cyclase